MLNSDTSYFWPDLLHAFGEVWRVLKPRGILLVCNESAGPEDLERLIEMLDMSIYTQKEIFQTLLQAGFCNIACHAHANGKWLCITAQKP